MKQNRQHEVCHKKKKDLNSYLLKKNQKNFIHVKLKLIVQLKEPKSQESTPHFYFTVKKNHL